MSHHHVTCLGTALTQFRCEHLCPYDSYLSTTSSFCKAGAGAWSSTCSPPHGHVWRQTSIHTNIHTYSQFKCEQLTLMFLTVGIEPETLENTHQKHDLDLKWSRMSYIVCMRVGCRGSVSQELQLPSATKKHAGLRCTKLAKGVNKSVNGCFYIMV